jgi:hypothetical protein
MTDELVSRAEEHAYQRLFIHDLHWSAPDHAPITYESDDGHSVTATNVSSYRGLRVWVCDELPGPNAEAELDRYLAKTSTDRIVIFHSEVAQAWRWPIRRHQRNSTVTRLTRHVHRTGTVNPKFAARLDAIRLPTDVVLDANAVLARVRSAFDVEAQNETKRASKLMARMYAAVEKAYPEGYDSRTLEHEVSVTLARILFLMFGDDTDMWAANAFRDFVHSETAPDGSDIGAQLNRLFRHLDTVATPASDAGLSIFPYVNGRLFEEQVSLPVLSTDFRDAVLDACSVDWSTISPAIFGSMFQSVRDDQTRRELGEHYTSEENILKTLNPLFLDDLRSEFDRATTMKGEKQVLARLWQRLGDVRFLDPACGCGNFIIVAYRELRDLELRIMERLQELSGDAQLSFDPKVSLKVNLDHFYGIELDEWPARIAETAMFLVDRQCDLKLKERFGESPQRLPIQVQATIVSGRSALSFEWSDLVKPGSAVVVAGNPPFLGISYRSEEQTEELKRVWGDQYHGTLDYVTGWHCKALEYFRDTEGLWAFVATSSITQGEAVAPLFGPIFDGGWRIKLAHRTFRWTSEAAGQAAVHCVIIGFSRAVAQPRLFAYVSPDASPIEVEGVVNITPYLTDGPTIIVHAAARPLNPQLGEVVYGNKPTDGGWLVVEPEDYQEVVADPVAARYVRRYVGARELLHDEERYCLWLVDVSPADLRESEVLKRRVDGVRAFRAKSKAASTREAAATPHLFRQISQPETPYLCIPAHVSEARPYFLAARFDADVITSNANFLAPDADGFMFAIISSTMFITWQRTVGGRLESRLRFNKLLTWNTFPLPSTDADARARIIEAGLAVQTARRLQSGLSLAELYASASLSSALISAHAALDEEVDKLFGFRPRRWTDLDRQDTLFARYDEFAAR